MNNKFKTLLATTFVSFVVLFSIGCETSSQQTESKDAYSWVSSLEEKVETVPTVVTSQEAPMATPTSDDYLNSAWSWGSPKNLLQPVSNARKSGSNTGASIATPNPGNKTHRGDQGSGSNAVVVNVNQRNTASGAEEEKQSVKVEDTSRLESLYGGKFDRNASRELIQFGYSFFESKKSKIEAVGPVPESYILGPGDEVIVSLSGGVDAYHRLTVDRDGFIIVPEFGSFGIAGTSFGGIHSVLMSFFEERRKGFDLTVSMGRLRRIQVNVVGRVENPGVVEIPALGTAMSALIAAGGPQKDGSLRSIALFRASKGEASNSSIDLYEFLHGSGSLLNAETLQDGDTLQVPAIGKTVGVAGYVQQPGIYEIKSETFSVGDAVRLAGGLTPFSFTPLAHLERTVDGRGRQKIDVELTEEGMSELMDNGELLMVEAVDDERQALVRIEGEVARPGDYQYRPGMTLSELVNSADGLTIDAYLPQVFVSRQLGKSTTINTITDRSGHKQTRRVMVVDLGKALQQDAAHDIVLMPLDMISVRSFQTAQKRPLVEIIGSVQRPGKYELTAGMRVSDLIAIARNPTEDVYYDQAELIRRVFDPQTRRLDVKRFRFDLGSALHPENNHSDTMNPILANGDKLVIRSLQQAQVRVRIDGQVRFPGEYIFPAGAKLTDLIAAAGGILGDADMRAAHFSRVSTRMLQQNRMDHLTERTRRLYEGAFEHMVQVGSTAEGVASKLALEQTQDTLSRMKHYEADGRIVIPFETPGFPTTNYNLNLESGDRLIIPRRHSTISVSGHVFRPLSMVAGKVVTVEEALNNAGGLTEFADEDLLYVIRAGGSVDSVAQNPARLRKSTVLLAGDVLLVPRKPMERTLGAKLASMMQLLHQAAEVGVLGSQIGRDVDMTIVSPGKSDHLNASAELLLDQ